MSLNSLRHTLKSLEHHDGWRVQRQFQQVLDYWAESVGTAVARQTRPIAIQRRVLQVATASPAWAQNLIFERQRILQKLNLRLAEPLVDIRFSTAQWHRSSGNAAPPDATTLLWQQHPSRIASPNLSANTVPPPADANAAFQRWAKVIQQRSQHLPLCPKCQCPTPAGELERWSICALCVSQEWTS